MKNSIVVQDWTFKFEVSWFLLDVNAQKNTIEISLIFFIWLLKNFNLW